jgi:uncharacterized membrane protein YidH (DUF202 family)
MVVDTELIGSFIELIGKLLLAMTVIMVHRKLIKEHQMDRKVATEIHHEEILTLVSVFFMILGFVLRHSASLSF